MMREDAAPLVIGGGPAGCCLAALLADQGWPVQLLEAQSMRQAPDATLDLRTLALAQDAWTTLGRIGISPAGIGAMPIRRIHVSYRGRPGRVVLEARESRLEAFGYTTGYGRLLEASRAAVLARPGIVVHEHARAERVAGASSAAAVSWRSAQSVGARRLVPLAVIADGGNLPDAATTLRWRYRTEALACLVRSDGAPGDTAWERFTGEGPLALLPAPQGYALIWSGPAARIRRLLAADEAQFLAELQHWFGDRAGRFTAASARAHYPLHGRFALLPAGQRVVRIANAAQALHPVAGQGFNLGLRDVRALAAAIGTAAQGVDPGSRAVLDAYTRARGPDRRFTAAMTHLLAEAFALPVPGSAWPGSLALAVLDLNAGLRQRFAQLMGTGVQT